MTMNSSIRERGKAHVAAALLVDSLKAPRRMLITQRTSPEEVCGKWEFPGGKIEEGEDPQAALRRELDEELGVRIDIGDELYSQDSRDCGGWPITRGKLMRLWFVEIIAGTPLLLESQSAMQWVSLYDSRGKANRKLLGIEWLDSDIPIVEELLIRLDR